MIYNSSIKAQAAIEFLTTYGWAILILMIVLAFAFYLLSSQASITSTICTINSGFKCTEFLVESNTISSTVLFFLNNIQQYPVKGTTVTANISSIGTVTAKCIPNFVLPGGDMLCTGSLSQTFSNTLSIGGKISVNSTICTDISNPISCNKKYPINYSGTLYTRVVGYAPQQCSISISSNTESPGINILYPVHAIVKMNNNPIPGATVNFSSTSSSLKISPSFINTETNGTATTYVTSTSTGSNTITASFYNTCATSLSLLFSQTSGGSSSQQIYYTPITLSNDQSNSVPADFQQMIYFNPTSYSSNEMANLSNIEFTASAPIGTSGNVPLYSWIESGASSSATNTVIWVNLGSNTMGAAGSGSNTLTIYMNFLNSNTPVTSGYTGYAPQLWCASGCFQTSYAQYDNGQNVFSLYFNGDTPISDFNNEGNGVSQATSVLGPTGSTINAISVTGYASALGFVYTASSLSNQALIAESSSKLTGLGTGGLGADNGQVSLVDRISTTALNAISVDVGFGSSYFSNDYFAGGTQTANVNSQGTATANWIYSSITYTGTLATSWNGYIAPQLYSTTGGYSGSVSNNPFSSSTTLYLGLIGDVDSIDVWQTYINWMRARAYPPNGVMPSISFGILS